MTTLLQLILAALLAAQSQVPAPPANVAEATTPSAGVTTLGPVTGGAIGSPAQAIRGTANYADPSHGSGYLAMRLPRGTRVTITGPGGSWHATVNDYGPAKRTGDIADIALIHFARICGWSVAKAKRMGECTVTVEWGGDGPSPTLPPTDAAS